MSTVLVTGGAGFIGSYCILQLLAAGHRVHIITVHGGAVLPRPGRVLSRITGRSTGEACLSIPSARLQ